MTAAVDHTPDPDQVARFEGAYMLADCRYAANDLVPGHAGKHRARPFGACLVQIGMAHAAEGDVDLDIVRAWCAPDDVHRLKWFVGGMCAVGFDCHG
jgi:hypothetical protein